jgi:hypothetical protein
MADGPKTEFGLRFFREGREFRLIQIAGDGRVRLGDDSRVWWAKRPRGVDWQPYKTSEGETFASREEAEKVARNLTR